jgi:hypothetical protein
MTVLAFTAHYARDVLSSLSTGAFGYGGHVTRGDSNPGGLVSRVLGRVEDAIGPRSSRNVIRNACRD